MPGSADKQCVGLRARAGTVGVSSDGLCLCPQLQRLQSVARRRGSTLRLLPPGMGRHQLNTSRTAWNRDRSHTAWNRDRCTA